MVTAGNYTYGGEHSVTYRIVKSLCCASETNITIMSTILQ